MVPLSAGEVAKLWRSFRSNPELAAETDSRRSTLVGLAVRSLGRLEVLFAHGQAGNRHWLAPQGLSDVLGVENSSGATWKTR